MKVRKDFVTNSSSSSFLISKKNLDYDQIQAIRIHGKLGEKLGINWFEDSWDIEESKDFITGYTHMDNFDMEEFLEKIDVDMRKVKWGEWRFDLPDENELNWRNFL